MALDKPLKDDKHTCLRGCSFALEVEAPVMRERVVGPEYWLVSSTLPTPAWNSSASDK